MLSRQNRADKKIITEIVKGGKNFSSDFVYLKVLPMDENESVFSFVVSSKVSKKATERNKLKRRARNILKNMITAVKDGLGVVFFFKKEAKDKNFGELKEEMTNLLKKARILK